MTHPAAPPAPVPPFPRFAILALFVLACLGVGFLGAAVTRPEIAGWYAALDKPWFQPPNWLFGPVWTVLYLMMAVAAWRIAVLPGAVGGRAPALALFAVQLALNLTWSFVFFGAHRIGWAVVVILALWLAIFATLLAFVRLDRVAGVLLLPYIAWVTFASVLNLAILRLNG